MQLKELFTDDDAVSPVIGVILMVAITVILAAVIGAFVLNIGGSQENAPQVTWQWSDDPENSNNVVLKHGGGDKIKNPGQISYTVSGDVTSADNTDVPTTAGESVKIIESSGADNDTGTIQVVWESSDGSDSQILSEHDYSL